MRCTVLDDYQGVATVSADWTTITNRVEVRTLREHFTDEGQLAQILEDDEIVVIMRERTPFTRSLFEQLPRLRLLVTTGRRNNSIDLAAASTRGVTVCGTASSSQPPAELTWALILGLARGLPAEGAQMRGDGPWQSTVGTDLSGATLGLVGLGKIGSQVARVGLAFGMDVQAWSQNLTAEHAEAQGVRCAASMADLFASSDFVSIHVALGDRSRGLVDRAALARMRPNGYLINTARAAIVDQTALIECLEQRRIAGAGLDVFDIEPLPAGHPFRVLPNVLATPHLGYVTRANYATYFTQIVEDIAAFLDGRPIRTLEAPS